MLGLDTLPDDQKDEPWYNTVQIGYAWIAGFRRYNYWSNTTNCFDRATNFTYYEYPAWQANMDDEERSDYEKLEFSLQIVSNMSVHAWYCSDMIQDSSLFWHEHWLKFTSFGHFLLSML